MQGIERDYCNVSIRALITTHRNLLNASAAEALNRTVYGKGDTLGLDAIPEIQIRESVVGFDQNAILITEEEELDALAKRRWPTDADPIRQPLILISDPTDRSKQLKKFFQFISEGNQFKKIGRLMGRTKSINIWEKMFEAPASITGATCSITAIRKGELIFSVILNYITQTIYVATSLGVFQLHLPHFDDPTLDEINLEYIIEQGDPLIFPSAKSRCQKYDDLKWFVTFLGKSGYKECFEDCMIFVHGHEDYLHHQDPGGPSRILYLSDLQRGHGPLGFVVANGEKIGEWIHWLAFVKFARNRHGNQDFKVYEVYTDRPYYKYGMLMSTSPSYSIFRTEQGKSFLDISRLRYHDRPSKFRSMIVVAPSDNEYITHTMLQHGYREISLFF